MRFAAVLLLALAVTAPASAMIATGPIRDVMRAAYPRFSSCMSHSVRSAPGEHRFMLTFTIEPSGAVSAAEIDSHHPDPSVVQCFLGVVRTLRFPAFGGRRGEVRINYPLVFSG